MDDIPCYQFFLEPSHPLQRRYEALRAVFVEARPQQEVALRFGFSLATLRQMIYEFRGQFRNGTVPPFFLPRGADDHPTRPHPPPTTRCRPSPIVAS